MERCPNTDSLGCRFSLSHDLCSPPVRLFALENLVFREPCTFSKHDFDLRSIPAHPGLPSGLVAVKFQSNRRSDPLSMNSLVDFFITTGTSNKLRDIKFCPSRSLRVMTDSDISLNKLVRHSGQSLHHLSLSLWGRLPPLNSEDASPHSDQSLGASQIIIPLK